MRLPLIRAVHPDGILVAPSGISSTDEILGMKSTSIASDKMLDSENMMNVVKI